jgi:phospholipid/cholesterol/gamma-HCH transport system substrate-binding protein
MKMWRPILTSVAFVLVTAAIGALLVGMLRGEVQGDTNYSADFTDISGLEVGDDVRASGVSVGKVDDVEVRADHTVRVSFAVADGVPMTTGTQVSVKYVNLIGDRYLSLAPGPASSGALSADAVLPVANTHPALDLDALYNGFAPLFEGLQPEEINRLSSSMIAILQGEGGAVQRLLADTGSLTGSLADRDHVIGRLIDNIDTVLGTLDTNDQKVGELVGNLQTLVSGLAADRERIGGSLRGITDLTTSLSDLLRDGRPDIAGTVHQVDRLSSVINADAPMVESDLSKLPGYYSLLGRVGAYSSAFQFYICGVQLRLKSPTGDVVSTPMISSEVERCQY